MKLAHFAAGIFVILLISIPLLIWLYPSPEDSASALFEEQYREIASPEHYGALQSLRCTPKGGYSLLARSFVYRCNISTVCGEEVTQRIDVDRVLGTRTGSEPFYMKFAQSCTEILNEETAAEAAAENDQDG
ncbi:MAG: hypothetical protein AAF362_05305 [Pseudomonadota bacterium]